MNKSTLCFACLFKDVPVQSLLLDGPFKGEENGATKEKRHRQTSIIRTILFHFIKVVAESLVYSFYFKRLLLLSETIHECVVDYR